MNASQYHRLSPDFAEEHQKMGAAHLSACSIKKDVVDLMSNEVLAADNDLVLNDHQSAWLDIS